MRILAAIALSAFVIQYVCWKVDSPLYLLYLAPANRAVTLTLLGCGAFIGLVIRK